MITSLTELATQQIAAGHDDFGLRVLQDIVGLGNAMRSSLPALSMKWTSEQWMTDMIVLDVEKAGYSGLATYYKQVGDAENEKRERDALAATVAAFRERSDEYLAEQTYGYPG